MFKDNEKVIFVGGDPNQGKHCINPDINEIVTINGKCPYESNAYSLIEYPISKRRTSQYFWKFELKKIDYIFGKKIVAQIEKEISPKILIEK